MRSTAMRNERGVALILALLLTLVVAALAAAAIMLSSSASLIGRFHVKDTEMRAAAEAGVEWARDTLNGTTTILPANGFVTLQNAQPVRDASGNVIPGYTRSIFAGRSGATTGQFGVFASVISRIDDNAGRAVVVRRGELTQESFAKFARFDDTTTSSVQFRNGIQVFGPIHTNGVLYVGSSPGNPATFHGPATTASTINAAANGVWQVGYKENVARINMPTPADLATLRTYSDQGKYHPGRGRGRDHGLQSEHPDRVRRRRRQQRRRLHRRKRRIHAGIPCQRGDGEPPQLRDRTAVERCLRHGSESRFAQLRRPGRGPLPVGPPAHHSRPRR